METVNNAILGAIFNIPGSLPVISNYSADATTFEQYTGTYTSTASPLIIDISTSNNYLLAQPRGQRIYTMEPVDKHIFTHEKTHVTLTFNAAGKQMLLKQGSQSIMFTKQ